MAQDWKDILANATGYTAPQESTDNAVHDQAKDEPGVQKNIKIQLDKKQRAGKTATLIFDIDASADAVKEIAKELKTRCGVGGSTRGTEILIQGDARQKCLDYFTSRGWKAKII